MSTIESRFRKANPGTIRTYDINLDCFRNATQRDFDLAMHAAGLWYDLRREFYRLEKSHKEFRKRKRARSIS